MQRGCQWQTDSGWVQSGGTMGYFWSSIYRVWVAQQAGEVLVGNGHQLGERGCSYEGGRGVVAGRAGILMKFNISGAVWCTDQRRAQLVEKCMIWMLSCKCACIKGCSVGTMGKTDGYPPLFNRSWLAAFFNPHACAEHAHAHRPIPQQLLSWTVDPPPCALPVPCPLRCTQASVHDGSGPHVWHLR